MERHWPVMKEAEVILELKLEEGIWRKAGFRCRVNKEYLISKLKPQSVI